MDELGYHPDPAKLRELARGWRAQAQRLDTYVTLMKDQFNGIEWNSDGKFGAAHAVFKISMGARKVVNAVNSWAQQLDDSADDLEKKLHKLKILEIVSTVFMVVGVVVSLAIAPLIGPLASVLADLALTIGLEIGLETSFFLSGFMLYGALTTVLDFTMLGITDAITGEHIKPSFMDAINIGIGAFMGGLSSHPSLMMPRVPGLASHPSPPALDHIGPGITESPPTVQLGDGIGTGPAGFSSGPKGGLPPRFDTTLDNPTLLDSAIPDGGVGLPPPLTPTRLGEIPPATGPTRTSGIAPPGATRPSTAVPTTRPSTAVPTPRPSTAAPTPEVPGGGLSRASLGTPSPAFGNARPVSPLSAPARPISPAPSTRLPAVPEPQAATQPPVSPIRPPSGPPPRPASPDSISSLGSDAPTDTSLSSFRPSSLGGGSSRTSLLTDLPSQPHPSGTVARPPGATTRPPDTIHQADLGGPSRVAQPDWMIGGPTQPHTQSQGGMPDHFGAPPHSTGSPPATPTRAGLPASPTHTDPSVHTDPPTGGAPLTHAALSGHDLTSSVGPRPGNGADVRQWAADVGGATSEPPARPPAPTHPPADPPRSPAASGPPVGSNLGSSASGDRPAGTSAILVRPSGGDASDLTHLGGQGGRPPTSSQEPAGGSAPAGSPRSGQSGGPGPSGGPSPSDGLSPSGGPGPSGGLSPSGGPGPSDGPGSDVLSHSSTVPGSPSTVDRGAVGGRNGGVHAFTEPGRATGAAPERQVFRHDPQRGTIDLVTVSGRPDPGRRLDGRPVPTQPRPTEVGGEQRSYHTADPRTGQLTDTQLGAGDRVTHSTPANGQIPTAHGWRGGQRVPIGDPEHRVLSFRNEDNHWDVQTVPSAGQNTEPRAYTVIPPAVRRNFTPPSSRPAYQVLRKDSSGNVDLLTYPRKPIFDPAGADRGGAEYHPLYDGPDGWRQTDPLGTPDRVERVSSAPGVRLGDGARSPAPQAVLIRDGESGLWVPVRNIGDNAAAAEPTSIPSYFRFSPDAQKLEPIQVHGQPMDVMRIDPATGMVRPQTVRPAGDSQPQLAMDHDGSLVNQHQAAVSPEDMRFDPQTGRVIYHEQVPPAHAGSGGDDGGGGGDGGGPMQGPGRTVGGPSDGSRTITITPTRTLTFHLGELPEDGATAARHPVGDRDGTPPASDADPPRPQNPPSPSDNPPTASNTREPATHRPAVDQPTTRQPATEHLTTHQLDTPQATPHADTPQATPHADTPQATPHEGQRPVSRRPAAQQPRPDHAAWAGVNRPHPVDPSPDHGLVAFSADGRPHGYFVYRPSHPGAPPDAEQLTHARAASTRPQDVVITPDPDAVSYLPEFIAHLSPGQRTRAVVNLGLAGPGLTRRNIQDLVRDLGVPVEVRTGQLTGPLAPNAFPVDALGNRTAPDQASYHRYVPHHWQIPPPAAQHAAAPAQHAVPPAQHAAAPDGLSTGGPAPHTGGTPQQRRQAVLNAARALTDPAGFREFSQPPLGHAGQNGIPTPSEQAYASMMGSIAAALDGDQSTALTLAGGARSHLTGSARVSWIDVLAGLARRRPDRADQLAAIGVTIVEC